MSEETLLTAARRAVRFFNIDEEKGGITSEATLKAIHTLDIQVRKEADRQKQAAAAALVQTEEADHA